MIGIEEPRRGVFEAPGLGAYLAPRDASRSAACAVLVTVLLHISFFSEAPLRAAPGLLCGQKHSP